MNLDFLPEASAELYAAAEYYEEKEEGLGCRFRNEVAEVCRLMVQHPLLWRERPGGYRRVNCPVFPYYLAYFIRGDRVVIAAVAHGHRRPRYFEHRLGRQPRGAGIVGAPRDRIDHANITLEFAQNAIRAYNDGLYAGGQKNPDLDRQALALFKGGLGLTRELVLDQVRFVGVDYGGAAGFRAAHSLVPAIADAIWTLRDRYANLAGKAPSVLQGRTSVDVIAELFAPFRQELHGKRNWLVWATKFWHFLNSDAFPVLDSRVDHFFGTAGRRQSAEKYILVCDRFREFVSAHAEWLPALRSIDGGLAWSDTKLWDKVFYGSAELEFPETRTP